jgi:hypothetical protein
MSISRSSRFAVLAACALCFAAPAFADKGEHGDKESKHADKEWEKAEKHADKDRAKAEKHSMTRIVKRPAFITASNMAMADAAPQAWPRSTTAACRPARFATSSASRSHAP